MTPAIALLEKQNVRFSVHDFGHQASTRDYGKEAARKLELSPDLIFKTLVTQLADERVVIALVPVSRQLDTKKLAASLRVKKATMAPRQAIQRLTGYLPGAVSPLAQRRRFPTIIDISARALDVVYISAGKRGVDICLTLADLAQLTSANIADISTHVQA
ncbi:Cys-tRNA(Pro) deacylase [Salinimonas chungwhensis]|uniref:Cys-tRNA(Pro) deacylase n=1 Tax=Salinimonas chungwhensis TaxID=265425 RepID=UPI0003648723|nr:Cys-tRNA(Pro) deacylase [Salinimonas chungwhensis]